MNCTCKYRRRCLLKVHKRERSPVNVNKTILIAFLLLGFYARVFAQERLAFQAKLLTVDDGLANLLTTSVFKSSDGFLWVGTTYGLNRYDGSSCRLYTKENNELAGNARIRQITEAPGKKMLLFYKLNSAAAADLPFDVDAVDVFDRKTERAIPFETFFAGKAPFKVLDLVLPRVFDPQKRVWFGTKNGDIYLYDGKFKLLCHLDMPAQFISVENSGKIWVGQQDKIVEINQDGKRIQSYPLPGKIYGLFTDAHQGVWFYTDDKKELHFWHLSDSGAITPLLLHQNGAPLIVPSSSFSFVHRHQNGYWFVDVDGALNVFSTSGAWLFNFNTLLGKNFRSQYLQGYEDAHSMWLSTPAGVLQAGVKEQLFNLIQKAENGLSDCRGITEYPVGNIYFLNRELYKWSKETQSCNQVSKTTLSHVLIYLDSLIWSGCYSAEHLGFEVNLNT